MYITKRFISYNGISYYSNNTSKKLIRLGSDDIKNKYFNKIIEYKQLENDNTSIIYNGFITINPYLNQVVAQEILEYRMAIQRLQFYAMDHYIFSNNTLNFITKREDRNRQIRHEYVINLYRKFLNLPPEEFNYFRLL